MNVLSFVMSYLDWILLVIGGAAAFWLVWVKGW